MSPTSFSGPSCARCLRACARPTTRSRRSSRSARASDRSHFWTGVSVWEPGIETRSTERPWHVRCTAQTRVRQAERILSEGAAGLPDAELLRARDVAAVLWGRVAHLPHEEFWAVLMNARLQEIRCVQIARGGLTQCSVSPREAFAPALVHRAPAVAFVHNHPSGDPAPSGEDQRLQLLLDEAGHALGVRVVDHLVLAEAGLHSAVEGACGPPDAVSLVPREGVG
ncbi:MAG: hypothetical protein E6J84_09105 [Deltaproteobacteria bacterium]|nr:MAG: hypothetical protein E6J84_09105 [Deltaproteobacteria bacterium]